ncbi:MAG: type II toxin-antitoxin system death-on-curing family toxin [Phycisphaerales bacterium]
MTKPPRFLSEGEVVTLHELAIQAHGGSTGLRDRGMLQSALAMPQQGFGGQFAHTIPFGMAAAYVFHLSKNHPFVDGNKRVAFAAGTTFLFLNGWELTAADETTADVVLAVVDGSLTKGDLEAWIQSNVRARPTIELRDFFAMLRTEQLARTFESDAAGPMHERVASILEASGAIPAIFEGNAGAVSAEQSGDQASADILRQHTMLLTAIYRIAEDTGYEW